MEDFVASIESGSTPASNATSGLHVVRMLEAAAQSLSSRGYPIEFSPLRVAS
jgi:hypothetical protein